MTTRASKSGIGHEIMKKVQKNRDPEVEQKAVEWMTQVAGKAPPEGEYEVALKDGVYLCEVMNAIQPGSVKKIHTKGQAFVKMQNIEAFCTAMRTYGVSSEDIFQTVDLWEGMNIPAVTKSIYALARCATAKGWSGPELGPKQATENKREFTEQQIRAGRDGHIGLQAGYNQGATQSGMNMGNMRHIVD